MIEEDLLHQLHAWSQGSQRLILGIVGLPGAGKSTLTEWIKPQLTHRVAILPMDGFHLANNQLARLARSDRKGAEDTFDTAGLAALLERIRRDTPTETIYAPNFHRDIEESIAGELAICPQARLVIVEGNYLLLNRPGWREVTKQIDQTWFIQVDEKRRLEQLKQRHQRYGRSEQQAEQWIVQTDQPNAELIQTTAKFADRQITIK